MSFLRCAVAVIVPWALMVLPLAADDPKRATLAISPVALLVIPVQNVGLATRTAMVIGGTVALICILAWLTRGSEKALLPIGAVFFFLGAGFSMLMLQ